MNSHSIHLRVNHETNNHHGGSYRKTKQPPLEAVASCSTKNTYLPCSKAKVIVVRSATSAGPKY